MDLAGRRGIVTGAGSGIGRGIAVEFGRRGGELLLVGRRADALQETAEQVAAAGGMGFVHVADLSAEDAPVGVAEAAAEALGGVNLLVNNAGTVWWGRTEQASAAELRSMVTVNLTAPILLTAALLPVLRAADDAVVLNIGSGIGLVGLPFAAVYGATKAGLARFGESLRRELLDTAVHVATMYPGPVATEAVQGGMVPATEIRSVAAVVADVFAGLENDEHEIHTSTEERQAMLRRGLEDPFGLDADLAPRLADMEAALGENGRS